VFDEVHVISPGSTSAHWLMRRPSLAYRNHERYDSHLRYTGTDPEFKKKPPNSRKGIMTGGPTDRAIDVEELAQDIRYPKDVDTLATRVTSARQLRKCSTPARRPIIG